MGSKIRGYMYIGIRESVLMAGRRGDLYTKEEPREPVARMPVRN